MLNDDLSDSIDKQQTDKNVEYDLDMPIYTFKQMVSKTKPDKNLKCLNLIGIDWMPLLH